MRVHYVQPARYNVGEQITLVKSSHRRALFRTWQLVARTLVLSSHASTSVPTPNSYASVYLGDQSCCAVSMTGHAVCWGYAYYAPSSSVFAGMLGVSVDLAGLMGWCVLDTGGAISCSKSTPPVGKFVQMASQWSDMCALDISGHVNCMGVVRAGVYAAVGSDCGVQQNASTVLLSFWGGLAPPASVVPMRVCAAGIQIQIQIQNILVTQVKPATSWTGSRWRQRNQRVQCVSRRNNVTP
jgi:hypothetical protein